jgi:hypothetical protein
MDKRLLPVIDDRIKKYEAEHKGERPLYIILPREEAAQLVTEVKDHEGFDDKVVVTEYHGAKIVHHEGLKEGEIRLTNELPETGS